MNRVGVLAGLIATAGCGPSAGPDPLGPSVLIVTLDATRADRLGAYGYPLAETPTWDWLAKRGARFSRAYASSPLTIPSHATILTGRAPPAHGVRDDGDFVLGDEVVTLAERFRDAGWATAAFTAAFPTQRRWGLDQGFERYHDPLDGAPNLPDWGDQRRADEVVDDALATLPTLGDRPIFAWVHLNDAHWPYDPPEPYASRHAARPYDGEIAFADAEAARLIGWFQAHRPGAIVVVTADHGEALGDGGEQTHGYLLNDGTIRVPLIVEGPGIPAGLVVDDPVGHVDIAPTVLALAGLQVHPGVQGRDLRDGGSERVYSEATTGWANLGLAPLHAYTDATGRFTSGAYDAFYPAIGDQIPFTPAPPPERGGPDLVGRAAILADLRREMAEIPAPPAALEAEALEMLSALGYVGGDPLGPDPLAGGAPPEALDPRDVMDVVSLGWQARQLIAVGLLGPAQDIVDRLRQRMPGRFGFDLLEAQLRRRQGDLAGALELYDTLYQRAPSATIALQIAAIHATVGEWRAAEAWYREALRRHPTSAEAVAGLARSVHAQGRAAEAEELGYDLAIVHPDHPELALIRADLLLDWGQVADAEREARRGLEALPWSPWAHATAARASWELGRPDEAIDELQEALRIAPYNRRVRRQLSSWLLEVGRNAEAVRLLAPLVGLLPDDPELAQLYAVAVRAAEAERDGIAGP